MENNTTQQKEKKPKQPTYSETLENEYKKAVEGIKKHGFKFGEAIAFQMPDADAEIYFAGRAIGVELINTNLLAEVIKYLQDTRGKHLLLLGSVGTGKTLIATKLIPLLIFANFKKIFKVYKATDLSEELNEAKKYPFVVIDDFGTETTAVNYGNKVEAFSEWLDSVEGRDCYVIATTNLDANQIKAKYGVRTYDRLRGLFKVIQVNEKSMRN